ncbi:MAG: hypothetical protein ACYCR2_02420 [Thermoplasmataceae archaeon]|jgi:hypothetical protein
MDRGRYLTGIILTVIMAGLFVMPAAYASTPPLSPPPSTLPSITYYYHNTKNFTITSSDWNNFFTDVIDNRTIVTYNWSANATQELIVFDLSYTGMNIYGSSLVVALSSIGSPTVANMTKAFWAVANDSSQVSGYTNIKALDSGAYPGFSWSTPTINPASVTERNVAIIVGIVAVTFILYFVFNRKH